jgi:type I restriction enzyme R subunit
VVTYKTEYAQSLIDDFANKDKMPHIAVSVDMLDTGIDVPEVLNLVFFKQVRSNTKFWQMVGRGTRLCKDLLGPGQDKQDFYIFDFCGNLEFFSQNPEFSEGSSTEPLSTRLFKARLQLVLELDKKLKHGEAAQEAEPPPYGDLLTEGQLRVDLAQMLHQRVLAMNVDNFVVRPQRRYVEKFAKAEAWKQLGADEVDELNTRLANLPSATSGISDDDEEAKRFDMLLLRTQLSILQAKPEFAALRDRIQRIAIELEGQMAIPAVKAEAVLIQALTSDEWWEDVTVPMLERVRRRLRALIKLLPKGQRKIVYTDFTDELGEAAVIELPQVTTGLDMSKFKEKARVFLKAHESHLSLQRLRRNQPLTPTDLDELEKMLLDAGGTPVLITEAKVQCQGLGLFVRSLVGLDRDAAMQAFSSFIDGTTATANQIEFVKLVVQELTQTGVMAPARLFESPFTDVCAQGPAGLFAPAQVTQFVGVLEEIRLRAMGA